MNKLALVTGASRGIGAATAVALAENGFDIVINYLENQAAAKEVSKKIHALGQTSFIVQADVSTTEGVAHLFRETKNAGTLSVLVNNAGTLEMQSPILEHTPERIQRTFQTNVFGPIWCCQAALKIMGKSFGGHGGVIINVGSGASRTGSPFEYVDYAASKGALDSLTIGLAQEFAEEGIRVNCVRPGLIYTDIHASGGEPERVDRLKHKLPLKRGGKPEEVAAAIAFLASEKSAYTTGAFLDVTGGR